MKLLNSVSANTDGAAHGVYFPGNYVLKADYAATATGDVTVEYRSNPSDTWTPLEPSADLPLTTSGMLNIGRLPIGQVRGRLSNYGGSGSISLSLVGSDAAA